MKTLIKQFYIDCEKPNGTVKKNHKLNIITGKNNEESKKWKQKKR
jgi:hypothetical protein